MSWPIVSRGFVLLAIGSVVGALAHEFPQSGDTSGAEGTASQCGVAKVAVRVEEISPEEAGLWCFAPGIVVLDVRSEKDFARGHVTGALHLPCHRQRLKREIDQRFAGATTILVYGHSDDDAQPVARDLMRRKYPDVRVIAGGFPAWHAAGQACASGPCKSCSQQALGDEHPLAGHR